MIDENPQPQIVILGSSEVLVEAAAREKVRLAGSPLTD